MFELPRYTSYRTTASPWLERLPSHWQTIRMKSLLRERAVKGYPDEPLLAATQSRGVIRKSDYGTRTVTATKDLHLLKLVEVGDFVISLRSFQGGIERCYHRGIISPAYTVLTAASDIYRDYLTHLFKSKPFVSSLTLAVTGIREGQNIDYAKLSVELLPVPPTDEQAAIVKYLAHANARIDKAIATKRRLIALLRESIGAAAGELISDYATSHGALRRLATVLLDGPTNGISPAVAESGTLETFSISAVRDGVIDVRPPDVKFVDQSSVRDLRKYTLERGDVLVVRGNGNLRLVGRAGVVEEDMPDRIYPDLLMRVRFRRDVDPRFMVRTLNSPIVRQQIEVRARTAVGSFKLSGTDVRGLRVVVPPLSDQRQVLAMLDEHERPARAAIARATAEVDLLQEFRTRLVADVVTGQLDVRDIASSLGEIDVDMPVSDQFSAPEDSAADDVIKMSEV